MKRILIPNGKVTAEFLLELGACLGEMGRFRERYPRGLKVTEKNLLKAKDEGFDIYWLLAKVLTKAELFQYSREGSERWCKLQEGGSVPPIEGLRFKYLNRHIAKPAAKARAKRPARRGISQ